MDLFKELKDLKNIEPSQGFISRSQKDIFFSPIPTARPFDFILMNQRMVFATMGIAAVFVFGIFRFVSPVKIANIDPHGLKAEAEAIQIQIELTNLSYPEAEEKSEDTQTTPSQAVSIKTVKRESQPSVTLDESIDKALEELAE